MPLLCSLDDLLVTFCIYFSLISAQFGCKRGISTLKSEKAVFSPAQFWAELLILARRGQKAHVRGWTTQLPTKGPSANQPQSATACSSGWLSSASNCTCLWPGASRPHGAFILIHLSLYTSWIYRFFHSPLQFFMMKRDAKCSFHHALCSFHHEGINKLNGGWRWKAESCFPQFCHHLHIVSSAASTPVFLESQDTSFFVQGSPCASV